MAPLARKLAGQAVISDWKTINEELYNNIAVHEGAHPLARGKQGKQETDLLPGAVLRRQQQRHRDNRPNLTQRAGSHGEFEEITAR